MTYCQIATVADPSPLLLLNTLICIQSLYKWWLSWTAPVLLLLIMSPDYPLAITDGILWLFTDGSGKSLNSRWLSHKPPASVGFPARLAPAAVHGEAKLAWSPSKRPSAEWFGACFSVKSESGTGDVHQWNTWKMLKDVDKTSDKYGKI